MNQYPAIRTSLTSNTIGLEPIDLSRNKFSYAQVDLVKVLTEKFCLTKDILRAQEILEEAIVKYAQQINPQILKEIPNTDMIFELSSWATGMRPLGNYLLVNYKGLTLDQRKAIIKAFQDKYPNLECFTLETFEHDINTRYRTHLTAEIHSYKFDNVICFELDDFCKYVLDDLKPYLVKCD